LVPLALAAAALLGAGCGERSEPTGALAQTYPVTVQGAGDQPTVLDRRARRIVALDPGAAELVGALGAGSRLVGVPSGARVADAPHAKTVVSHTGGIDIDEVIALGPDLVLATPTIDQIDLGRIEKATKAAVYVQPAASVKNVEEGAVDLGFLIGEPAKARQLVGRIERKVGSVQKRLAGAQPVSVFVDTGFFITVPERSLLGDLVKRAMGESVAGASPGPGPYPLSNLRQANPDVFLATSDSDASLQSLKANPVTASLKAVKDKRVVVLPAALVNRAGPRVGGALEAIARALHPDEFQ
jgi:iron complex transport system substrate-binding protein